MAGTLTVMTQSSIVRMREEDPIQTEVTKHLLAPGNEREGILPTYAVMVKVTVGE
jgi:hypothetical protein